jgi:TolB-like protein
VYRVHDESLHVDVAMKVLRPELGGDFEARERFRREIVLARQVSHSNVVRIHDIGQDDDLTFLTMDLVAGRSLRSILEAEGSLPPDRAEELVRGLAAGLAAAHRQGIIHRDLKPENILMAEDGTARIADFGVAYAAGSARLTETGMLVGTLSYLSPEQASGDEVDARSDLYALGLIAVEMLTGDIPFRRSSQKEMLAQRLVSSPRLDELQGVVDERFRAALGGLLARDREERLPSAEAFLAVLDGEPIPPGVGAPVREAPRSPWRLAVSIGVAALALLAVAWLVFRPSGSEAPGGESAAAPTSAPPEHSLAVLPFVDETGSADLAWVSRGVAEMLAEELAASPELQVVDSFRVFRALDDLGMAPPWGEGRLRTLSDLLGVEATVTGRVRSLGDGLGVEAWLAPPDPSRARGVTVQADVAGPRGLPAAVRALASDIAAGLAVPRPESGSQVDLSPDARRAYDEGLELWVRGDAMGAVPRLQAAVAAEPALTSAWIHLADAYAAQGRYDDAQDALGKAAAAGAPAGSRPAFEIRVRRAQLQGDVEEAKALAEELVSGRSWSRTRSIPRPGTSSPSTRSRPARPTRRSRTTWCAPWCCRTVWGTTRGEPTW